ncbi:GNAT family N-acetyltransferase [Methanosarcina horonobensis]|uniref:GNAT family N-acetyltransferase n=1 Tax=Methanosarcina horonobensis TaxID=418008 RepID=UPI000ABAAFDA|nr:GNAT family N-acetyltransferase [Methanosarcina horonobensis]
MAEQIEILWATLEDAIEILALQKLAYQSEAQIYSDWTIPPLLQTAEEIRNEFGTYTFLKAISGHSIVGSVRTRTTETTCYIGRLIVHPKWQNRDGTRLMTEVEVMHRDVARFELFTGSDSIKNLHLYHKLGYQEFRREPLSNKVELVYLEKITIDKQA